MIRGVSCKGTNFFPHYRETKNVIFIVWSTTQDSKGQWFCFFTSRKFQDFMKSNGIFHGKVSPYHPI